MAKSEKIATKLCIQVIAYIRKYTKRKVAARRQREK